MADETVLPSPDPAAGRTEWRARRWRHRALAMAIGCLVVAFFWRRVSSQPWTGDEPHKISETYFCRLLLQHDLNNSAWYDSPISRGNPQVGKVLYGLAVLAGGDSLPADQGILAALLKSHQWTTPEDVRLANVSRLRSVRRVSVVSTGITAALIFLICADELSALWGLLSVAIFLRHYIVAIQITMAVYDATITAFVIAALWLFVEAIQRRSTKSRTALAVLCGIVCAAACQTRLSGLVAWGALIAACIVLSYVEQKTTFLWWSGVVTVVTLIASIAMNPFYWWPAPGVLGTDSSLPVRVVMRIGWQLQNLGFLARGHVAEIHSWRQRFRFEWHSIPSGMAGKVIAIGLIAVLWIVFRNRAALSERSTAILVWSGALSVTLLLWLPMTWDRYLEPVVAALAILTGIALGTLFSNRISQFVRRTMHS